MKSSWHALLAACVIAAGCARGERLSDPRPMRGGTPRDAYALTSSADAETLRAWEQASRAALRSGLLVGPAYRERLRMPDGMPYAVAYRLPLRRGQHVDITISDAGGTGAPFTDVFQDVGGDIFRHVHSADAPAFRFTAKTDGTYVLRLQPRIGAGGEYDIAIDGTATMLFPVAGVDIGAIRSEFGAARDGGARSHEGVDIFAPRGTPVVAAADGLVSAVRATAVGGLVVWLQDEARGVSYYYAHLDEQFVTEGSRVAAGTPLGTVGNTGNARGTSPHLHFGIYHPGRVAVDPAPLLAAAAPAEAVDAGAGMRGLVTVSNTPLGTADDGADLLGTWARAGGEHVRLRSAPTTASAIITELGTATPLLVVGRLPGWNRVLLEDGTTGFVAAEYTVR